MRLKSTRVQIQQKIIKGTRLLAAFHSRKVLETIETFHLSTRETFFQTPEKKLEKVPIPNVFP